ncbi:aminoglycoside phosphotransferase family protein [Paenibacillus koleovorans]|uniref:aminoglycoside phosphotransferase family protein n=1 Tax=Paenibacillus koleovorans TaxID=121608 RepID=UPI000FDB77B4|nr:aminoglycoside phosphotransferase family protein [Paenibacillus koleovorans]
MTFHNNEVAIDTALVQRLLAAQFPQWSTLPLTRAQSSGTDNVLYRLGEELAVRLPRLKSAAGQVEKERLWLPQLAPHLPLAIPTPLAVGAPDEGYPWPWAVYPWFQGEDAITGRIDDLGEAALTMAQFVNAMQQIKLAEGATPPPCPRDMSLQVRDAKVHQAIAELEGLIDPKAAALVWEEALQSLEWQGPPVWIHADLHAGNWLVDQGRICAVIDFGCVGVGDPAWDMLAAWSILTAGTRDIFRTALQVDDATWARGRGFALSMGLIALPYYKDTNPVFAGVAKRMLDEILLVTGLEL